MKHQEKYAQQKNPLKARRVEFDLSHSPLHWIPGDPVASHLVNGINLVLPAGELWFCRVYNKALPFVTDYTLREEVEGFIRQEASHAMAHRKGEKWLQEHGLDTDAVRERADWLFGQFLGEAPFGQPWLRRRSLEKTWLVARVGLIAAIEHFTGLLGDWCMNSKGWDSADPVVADLFRWHLAEEVEHRTVAYDLFEHLCRTQLGFYISRQALMAIVFPLFLYIVTESGRSLARQDPDPASQKMARRTVLRMLWELQRIGKQSDTVPKFSFLLERTVRWVSPKFHPITEGDTQQALAYIARSPAAQAGGVVH
ncbi:hypothetical protein A167_01199 [Alcanivorax sp. S71-1-4]|uniref:metal-dependent hydrolase n=1 Tax=Alcanivorax sp. S71-1-4 TaxID=1177159 RepID=UPI00135C9CFF|nr:metal-dependent hydrolase [Alcanivorax sp. S71-1-4]KAF0810168.1 hypothetical protein A167_01199 [Alcanivorax sp. S71-1-4]